MLASTRSRSHSLFQQTKSACAFTRHMHFSFPILLSPAGVHKTAQQTLAFRRLPTMFRVPLHGLYETVFRQVNSFDQPIRSHRLSSKPPSPLVFFLISTHFTATLGIPLTSPALQQHSFQSSSQVEPGYFTSDLRRRLRSLYTQ